MTLQRLTGDPELLTKGAHVGFPLPPRGHGSADLGRRQLERASTRSPSGSRRGQPFDCALKNVCLLELNQGSADTKDKLPGCSRRVDRRALTGEHLETDTAISEVMHRIDEVA